MEMATETPLIWMRNKRTSLIRAIKDNMQKNESEMKNRDSLISAIEDLENLNERITVIEIYQYDKRKYLMKKINEIKNYQHQIFL